MSKRGGRTLLVLLWKHYKVRRRRFIHTTVEYLSPCVYFILIFLIKDILLSISEEEKEPKIVRSEPNDIRLLARPSIILYYPQNDMTDVLMDLVGPSMGLQRMEVFNVHTPGYFGLKDKNATDKYVKRFLRFIHAVIAFKDLKGSRVPDQLNYTLRMNTGAGALSPKKRTDDFGPNALYGKEYEHFVRLQWAVDSSFLKLRTGYPVKQLVSVQEFPFRAKKSTQMITLFLYFFFIGLFMSLTVIFDFLMGRIMEERASGIQELIQMEGVTTRTLGFSHFVNVLPGGLVFSVVNAVLLTVGEVPIVEYSNPLLIMIFMFLHFLSIIAIAFAASYITHNTENTVTLATLVYIVVMIPAIGVFKKGVATELIPLTGLLPYMPAIYFMRETIALEIVERGVTFETMMVTHAEESASVLYVYLFLMVQTALFFLLAWYLSLVRPGNHGTALPWNFLCQKQFWSRKKVDPELDAETQKIDAQYFEKLPSGYEAGIDVRNVSKVFNEFIALNNVTVPVLKGEITVLLGHNGAGKTTLMSIITGTMSATKGKVFVNGMDTVTQLTAVRSQLGYCPQHNLFFNDLTVLEHVKFFTLLKGSMTSREAKAMSVRIIQSLGLADKANVMTNQLSGGMQRRLQLACALAGDASVLVLDEPTAGLDVETRRGLWDLLLSLRANRTVLLSTHFMEEADALGDRVAALHSGALRCFATPMFLKKAVDTGYRLSVTLKPEVSADQAAYVISKIIFTNLPRATQVPDSGIRTLAYHLPSGESKKFPALFKELENGKDKLGIEHIGVGVTTLEEVFMKLCSDVTIVDDEVEATLQDNRDMLKISGCRLRWRQFVALFVRQLLYTKSTWFTFFIMQVWFPVLVLYMVTSMSNNEAPAPTRTARMDLDLYRDRRGRRALSSFEIPLRNRPACCGLLYTHADDIPETLLDLAKDDKILYNEYLIGVKLNEDVGVAYYTTMVRHAMPVAVNALSNAIASTLPSENTIRISTINDPLQDVVITQPKSSENVSIWAIFITFIILSSLVNALVLPCIERQSSTRAIHFMSGCSPELHWMTSLLYHAIYSVLVLIIPTAAFAYNFDTNQTFSEIDVMYPLALALVGGCLATIAMVFLVSFTMTYKRAASALVAFYFLVLLVPPLFEISCQMEQEESENCKRISGFTAVITHTITPNTFLGAMMKAGEVARSNARCRLNKELCPTLVGVDKSPDTIKCCLHNKLPGCYFCWEKTSPLSHIVALYAQFVVFMTLVILTQRGVLGRLYDRILNAKYKENNSQKVGLLQEEQNYVNNSMSSPRDDALLLSSVHKCYPKLFWGKPVTAVRGVTLAVREGECFGLVGVNGAGKSTTFKMMTCETFPTRGVIVSSGQRQRMFNNSKYLNGLGYCPQFFGLDSFLTGRQNLYLLLTLDGLSDADAKRETTRWLQLIDLMKYADRPLSAYSGGCGRRLCSVAALARRAGLSLLDEPTAGVDVAARRRLWRAVRAAQHMPAAGGGRRAVLITSHSMDEMEALCSRVAIMRRGSLATLGSPASLRATHNAGYSIALKVKDLSNQAGGDVRTEVIEVCYRYQWILKDEHRTMLTYHVGKELNLEYSELFAKLEELRNWYPNFIEDYAVTETTLEEVFLAYARGEENKRPM